MLHMLTAAMLYLRSHLNLKNEEGQGMTEYALILALIAIVVIVTLTALGGHINTVFTKIDAAISNAVK